MIVETVCSVEKTTAVNSIQTQQMELTVASYQTVMATAWRSTVVVLIRNALKASGTVMQMKTVMMLGVWIQQLWRFS